MRVCEYRLAQRSEHRERRVEHQCHLHWAVSVFICVAQCHRTYVSMTPAAYRSTHHEHDGSQSQSTFQASNTSVFRCHLIGNVCKEGSGYIQIPMIEESAADSTDAQDAEKYQTECLQQIVSWLTLKLYIHLRREIKFPQCPYHQGCKKHQIPVAHHLCADDFA